MIAKVGGVKVLLMMIQFPPGSDSCPRKSQNYSANSMGGLLGYVTQSGCGVSNSDQTNGIEPKFGSIYSKRVSKKCTLASHVVSSSSRFTGVGL